MTIPILLIDALIYLSAAVIMVPLSRRFGMGAVLGYLVAGILIGPHALGLINDSENVLQFAEFGVVLLLFLIGLELRPQKLWAMRVPIFGMGGLQVLATLALVALPAHYLGISWPVALTAGLGFAMSSTAIGLTSLTERGLLESPGGQSSFSVLLFQDLAVVPCLMVLTLLSPIANADFHWQNAARALLVIAAIVFIGRHLLRPVLRAIAASGLREVFIAFSLLLVIGVSVLVSTVGLSMALGAFLAGVLLADSEYRHELELDIEPFKGLLLGLFFIAVGMSVDLGYIAQRPLLVFGLCGTVVLSKFVLLYGLARSFGNARGDALLFGVALSQVGEFAFVLFSVAQEKSILDLAQIKLLNAVTICSMLLTPIAFVLFRRFAAGRRKTYERAPDRIEAEAPVIVAGFGRFGQVIARLLYARGIATTVLERDPTQIELMRRFGFKAYYGDATRLDLLERAGIAHARLIVLAMDDDQANLKLARTLKKKYPQLEIVARAHGRPDAYEFMELGIANVRETFAAALEAGRLALQKLGMPASAALRMTRQFEIHDRELMRRALPLRHDQNALIGLTQQARRDLTALLAQEGPRRDDESLDRPSQLDSVLHEAGKAPQKLAD